MAATIPTGTTSTAGLAANMATASSDGDDFVNTGQELVILRNTNSGTSINVTFVTTKTSDGLAVADRVVNVPIAASAVREVIAGPFPKGTYNDPNTGKVNMTYSTHTGLTIGVIKLGAP